MPTTVVIPTIGRPSLRVLLEALSAGTGPLPEAVVVVDDRPTSAPAASAQQLTETLADLGLPGLHVLSSGGGGPAKARNLGWRAASTDWVSFLDDDVVPDRDWRERLAADLSTVQARTAGSQGRVRVPLPHGRPTDWERSTAGLASAQWITADMTYRRAALSAVGGFDERFPRAFREDADLGLRVSTSCGPMTTGQRWVTHPVRSADDWVSVRQQQGNSDDMLMRRLHGPDWRSLVGAPAGRRSRHLAVTGAALATTGLLAAGQRRLAVAPAVGWLSGTVHFAWARISPGPRDWPEVRRMVATSAVIPLAAAWHTARGALRHRRTQPWRGMPELVLFDRDGTLVHDVPYNGDPARVAVMHGAAEALDRLRSRGVRTGVVTNQSGVGAGRISLDQMRLVNSRVEELLGPFDVWQMCPHAKGDGCACRKPAPGMVKDACQALGVDPARCVVVGDIGSDVEAAQAAGAAGILVPTPATRPDEVSAAGRVCRDLDTAVASILAGRW